MKLVIALFSMIALPVLAHASNSCAIQDTSDGYGILAYSADGTQTLQVGGFQSALSLEVIFAHQLIQAGDCVPKKMSCCLTPTDTGVSITLDNGPSESMQLSDAIVNWSQMNSDGFCDPVPAGSRCDVKPITAGSLSAQSITLNGAVLGVTSDLSSANDLLTQMEMSGLCGGPDAMMAPLQKMNAAPSNSGAAQMATQFTHAPPPHPAVNSEPEQAAPQPQGPSVTVPPGGSGIPGNASAGTLVNQ